MSTLSHILTTMSLAVCPSRDVMVTFGWGGRLLSMWTVSALTPSADGYLNMRSMGGSPDATLGPKDFPALGDLDYTSMMALAFTCTRDPPLLLVAHKHLGQGVVQVLDIWGRIDHGHLGAPIPTKWGLSIATNQHDMVAVNSYSAHGYSDHVVRLRLYQKNAETPVSWTPLRVLGGGVGCPDHQLLWPEQVRFSQDGTRVCVIDSTNRRLSVFWACNGAFHKHISTGIREMAGLEAVHDGWVVSDREDSNVWFVADDGSDCSDGSDGITTCAISVSTTGTQIEWDRPLDIVVVPGLGLLVEEFFRRRFWCVHTPAMAAMAAMSAVRVSWMAATARAVVWRQGFLERMKRKKT